MPVTEFRAAVVVGSGSISFEMIRYLTERLPVMICPQWVYTRVQPIAVDDLLRYLVAALDVPESAGRVVEIGGADVLTYGEMMLGYAARAGSVAAPAAGAGAHADALVVLGAPRDADPLARSRGRSSRGCATRSSCATTRARDLFPAIHPVDYATRGARRGREPRHGRGRDAAGPTRSSRAAATCSRAC